MAVKTLSEDLKAAMARDPAARSALEVACLYPGFHVLLFHRAAHGLWRLRLRFLARALMQLARWLTGIEIHPAARIGAGLFIDHGMGVVIGETAEIGDQVTLYHGVTLGGTAPHEGKTPTNMQKRHPTLCDHVVVGAGAKILGPVMVREGAQVGSNAVVVRDVPAGATVVGIPGKVVHPKGPKSVENFRAYGSNDADPTGKAVEALMAEVHDLKTRLATLEAVRGIDPAYPTRGPNPDPTPRSTEPGTE